MDTQLLAHLGYLKPQEPLYPPMDFSQALKEHFQDRERVNNALADVNLLSQLGYLNKNQDTSPPGTSDVTSKDRHSERDRERRRERRRDEKYERRSDSSSRHSRYEKEDRYEDNYSDGYSSDGYEASSSGSYERRRERRERDRSPRRRRRYDSHEDYSHSERDSRSEEKDTRRTEHFENLPPNNTIMVRGMTAGITENELRTDIITSGMMPKDIRLIRRKDSGASRGFAFVEFNTVQEASRWMELRQGRLSFPDGSKAFMQYSLPKEGERNMTSTKDLRQAQDWVCSKCATRNFKRRETCFKCNISRQESDLTGDSNDEVSSHPTNTILLRNLDPVTSEEGVLEMLQGVSSLPIRAVRIGRDPATNISKGVCYIELNSVVDAIHLYKFFSTHCPLVDGKQVVVSYAKLNQVGISMADHVLAAAHWMNQSTGSEGGDANISSLAEYSASLYAKTPEEHAAYKQYYEEYYQQQQGQSSGPQNAVLQAQAMQQQPSAPSTSSFSGSSETPTTEYTKYPAPDVSKYQYDDTSGYYYDPTTGLYYDASSQYYYSAQTGQFMYWDSTKQTYLPAPTDAQGQPSSLAAAGSAHAAGPPGQFGKTDQSNEEDDKKKKDKDKKDDGDKVKVAKKIAKDMEKWAKTLNQKKEAAKHQQQQLLAARQAEMSTRGSGAADAGYAVLEKKSTPTTPVTLMDRQANVINTLQKKEEKLSPSQLNPLVASYGGGSDTDDDEDLEEKYTDWKKMACLLCKRQFPNKEALTRHQQLSDLHKQNMTKLQEAAAEKRAASGGQYRDRAAERRKKFGVPTNPQRNRLKEKYLAAREEAEATRFETPNQDGIKGDNLGSRMMQKMGWSQGQGLGKKSQGRTEIIQTEVRAQSAGLGSKATSYTPGPGETYRDAIRKMTLNRYKELGE